MFGTFIKICIWQTVRFVCQIEKINSSLHHPKKTLYIIKTKYENIIYYNFFLDDRNLLRPTTNV